MRTLIGMALVAVPMGMVATGDFSTGAVTFAGVVGAACWMGSGWFTD